jgi:hypothetical protein
MSTPGDKADTSRGPKGFVPPMDRLQPRPAAPHTRVTSANDVLFNSTSSRVVTPLLENRDAAMTNAVQLQSSAATGPKKENAPDSIKAKNVGVGISTTLTTGILLTTVVQTSGHAERSFEKHVRQQLQKSISGRHPILDAENNYAVSDEEDSAVFTKASKSQQTSANLELVPDVQSKTPNDMAPRKIPVLASESQPAALQKPSYASAVKGSDRTRVNSPAPKRDTTSSESKVSTESTSDQIIRKIGEVCASTSRQRSRSVTPTKRHGYGHRQHSTEQSARNSPLKHVYSSDSVGTTGQQFDSGTVIHRPNKAKYHNNFPPEWTDAMPSETRPDNSVASESTPHDSHAQNPIGRGKTSRSRNKKNNAGTQSTSRQKSTEHLPALADQHPVVDDPNLQPPGP